ncbi:hypothetical protein M8A51_26200 [Schlegelella sp. S2-27]|uniref:SMI1/KNR4 family protein n=1 Tax=Caldimonas mangrovi TaxID=2944811 RepID=A0ABT0YX56_9BURK|nr:DUF6756 family protein [Caldimonas mangrovi]MCM5683009.1 hypothetical protein [Caldimonas mangrovi]
METVVDEIRRAAETLAFSPSELRELPAEESEAVFRAALERFVASGDRRWWWEDFRSSGESVHFPAGDGWRHLVQVAPNADEQVWFIVEEDHLLHYPVYETTVRHAIAVVGECYGFEFYLVAKDLSWLLCETHHDVVCAVGEAVERRLLNHAP